jgi:hypothetical protein
MRTVLFGSPALIAGTLVGATRETAEPVHAVYGDRGSAWWSWTAPADGIAEISNLPDRAAYALAQVVAVYQGDSLSSLQEVTGESGLWRESAYFLATAGQTYQIVVSDIQDGRDIGCQLVLYDSPPNDNFSNLLPVVPGVTYRECNFFATMESGEPGGASAKKTLWWTWTAPAHGVIKFCTADTTVVQLFAGDAVHQLVARQSGNSFGVPGEEVFAGEVIRIRVDEHQFPAEPSLGHVEFSLAFSPVPTNDQFASQMVLTGLPVEVAGDNTMASAEPGEPRHMRQMPMNTLWYQWTATNSGRVGLLLDADWKMPIISIYTGTSLSNLVPMAGARYSPAPLMFTARTGRTYSIAVGTTWSTGPFRLGIVGSPPNDDFLFADVLTGRNAASNSYTTCATMESGEGRVTRFDSRQSVWWKWQAPFSALAEINVSADYPVPLQVYTGDVVSRLRPLPFQSYKADWQGSKATFLATSGTTYHIRASGVRYLQDGQLVTRNGRLEVELSMATLSLQTASGTADFVAAAPVTINASTLLPDGGSPSRITITVARDGYLPVEGTISAPPWELTLTNLTPGIYKVSVSGTNDAGERRFSAPMIIRVRPANDDFARRIVVADLPAMLEGSFAGATAEPGEPRLSGARETASVWYTWRSSSNSLLRVTVYDGRLGIFTGSSLFDLHLLRRYSPGTYSFNAVSNVTYQLEFSTTANSGNPAYAALFARQQSNDNFANRIMISGTNVAFVADNSAATSQSSEPGLNFPSLWWSWTSPGDGSLILTRTSTAPSTCFGIYQGSTLKTLRTVYNYGAWNASPVVLQVSNAVTYQIAVYAPDALEAGPAALNLRFIPQSTNDNFASRIRIDNSSPAFHGANYSATKETNEPVRWIRSSEVQATLWWEWTANANGVAVIDVAPGGFHPFVEMFEGVGLGSLTSLTTGTIYYSVLTSYSFSVEAGHTYFVSVGGRSTERGEFTCVLHPPGPAAE